ncbi:hypothetical protein THAPSDRAFT_268040 [Thalassiosira pseudonana CCMP1335]|uniref:HECT-type E3 ubiquitin transferase n=1 Tax=Thalassiosira pseudonana TaxID=35128 RepID=B8BR43_THAPS|nr:hypothetical protein THAPSDRAFT_268040 [Thalassiosira pseudonana CCMP1335]EED96465.1 hypothetical protein THAPSDRAFT_268040 [Thalassiosira pseudonana CCMP1335]
MFADERADTAKKRADEAKQRRIRAKREKEAKEARKRKELERPTASIMTTQFLFFAYPTTLKKNYPIGEVKLENASMILEDRDLSRWTKLVKHVLLPGVSSENSDLDPLLPWMESLAGQLRLVKVLELCVSSISRKRKVSKGNTAANATTCDRGNASDCYASVDSFLRTILRLGIPTEGGGSVYRGSTRDAVYQKSRAMLLQSVSSNQQSNAPSSGSKGQDNEPVSCDIMLSLRFILLYGSDGNTAPIPPDAERLRDKCISKDEKERIGLLFSLTADLLASPDSSGGDIGTYLSSRFVTEVLTVPLLVWKIPLSAYERLIQTTGSKTPPQLVVYIHHFINWNADKISDGRIDVALNVNGVSLSVCPAPAVLCLLANLTQIGKQCVLINGMDPKRFHYKVEWVTIGSSSSPIVLSDVVIEQASALISDSYVRALFRCAIDDDALQTQKILGTKTEKDKKHEKDLKEIGSESVASLAAKEAMVDRNRSFWQSSKWAKKLTQSMSNLISGSNDKPTKSTNSNKGSGQLMNTSSIARQLANGKGSINRAVTDVVLSSEQDSVKQSTSSCSEAKSDHEYSVFFLLSLCRAYGTIIARWGGGGKEDLVKRALSNKDNLKQASDPASSTVDEGNVGAAVLYMFVACFSHTLIVTDDIEIHEMEKPLPKHQLRRCILLLKKLLFRACCLDDVHDSTKKCNVLESNPLGLALISRSSSVMNDLYNRSSRRLLCTPNFWIEEGLLEKDLARCKSHAEFTSLLSSPVCRICPFLISFKRRLKLFERIVTTNRVDIQGSNEHRNLKPGIMVKVSRGRVLEDGLMHLNNLGRNMRQRIVVNYLSQAGTKETGVDVGGLFKEFWTDLSNMAFDPQYALFKVTEGSATMYPNPSSKFAHGSDHIVLFEFLGRILGKALYEGITIQPQFAHLFLSFLKGDHQYLHLLTDLSTLDTQLYNNLMFLKTYDGDATELCLTFTVANDDFGVSEVPLVANGANIEVTNENKRRYIYLVAKHHVCDRIKEQSDAFTRGLWEVIDRSWLRLFNEPELQVLISGASDGKIDVSDMKSNTRYTGGYSMLDRNIVRFWSVVSSFTPKQQADLLRFVTSCERPPPLGFASMNPPFTIQRVGIMRDGDKLPTASTCFNTLKLPTYSSEKVLKERLIYSIEAGAGFELT